jgi:hypothetical protein
MGGRRQGSYNFVIEDEMADHGIDPAVVGPPGQLIDILRRVAFLRGTTVGARNTWAMTVQQKLHDVEIFNIRDFVEYSGSINRRLQARHFKELHYTTMKLLLRAACDEIFEDGERSVVARAEALAEHTAQDEEDTAMPMRYEEHEDAAEVAGRIGDAEEVRPFAHEADV